MTLLTTLRACVFAAMWRIAEPQHEPAAAWRLSDGPVHVGLRPAFANEGAGLTLQVSVRTPW